MYIIAQISNCFCVSADELKCKTASFRLTDIIQLDLTFISHLKMLQLKEAINFYRVV